MWLTADLRIAGVGGGGEEDGVDGGAGVRPVLHRHHPRVVVPGPVQFNAGKYYKQWITCWAGWRGRGRADPR